MKKVLALLIALVLSLMPLLAFAAGDGEGTPVVTNAWVNFHCPFCNEMVTTGDYFKTDGDLCPYCNKWINAQDVKDLQTSPLERVDYNCPNCGADLQITQYLYESNEPFRCSVCDAAITGDSMVVRNDYEVSPMIISNKKGAEMYKAPSSTAEKIGVVIPYKTEVQEDYGKIETYEENGQTHEKIGWGHVSYNGKTGWIITADYGEKDQVEVGAVTVEQFKEMTATRNKIIIACVAGAVVLAAAVVIIVVAKKKKAAK